jgi:hypothetical protein
MQEDSRLQQVMQKLGDTLDEATSSTLRPVVPTQNANMGVVGVKADRQKAADPKPVANADQHEAEVAACVTQAWVRELVRKGREFDITPEDVKCLWHALKAIDLVAGE